MARYYIKHCTYATYLYSNPNRIAIFSHMTDKLAQSIIEWSLPLGYFVYQSISATEC